MDLRGTYNHIAEDWFGDHQKDVWSFEGAGKFASYLNPGSWILDIGCGCGLKSKYLINKGMKVVGIDFSEKMIEIAKKEVPEGEFEVMDLRNVSKLERVFDGIFLQAVLLHIPKNEVSRVLIGLLDKLKSGGYVYVAVKEKKPGGADEEIKKEQDYGYSYERFFSYFTLAEVKKYLENIGIEIIHESITPFGNTRWIQVM